MCVMISNTFLQSQQAAGGPKVFATALWLKTGIQVAKTERGANPHHHKQVSCCFKPTSPFYGGFSVQKKAFSGVFSSIIVKVQDDRRCAEYVFPMRAVVLS